MKEFILAVFNIPVATLLVTAGIVFLFIFTGGKVDRYGRVDTTRVDEQSSASIGVFLLAAGLIASVIQLNIKTDINFDHLGTTPPPCNLETSELPDPVPTFYRISDLPDASPESHRKGFHNLALLREARASASSVTDKDPGKFQVSHLNDGWYNACRSWRPDSLPAWFMIDLGKDYKVFSIAISSDHTNILTSTAITDFEVLVSSEKENWIPVFRYKNKMTPLTFTSHFSVKPTQGRYVKVVFNQPTTLQIDEVEIYGRPLKPWEMIRF